MKLKAKMMRKRKVIRVYLISLVKTRKMLQNS
jgi:hypothetical protein